MESLGPYVNMHFFKISEALPMTSFSETIFKKEKKRLASIVCLNYLL